MKTRNVTASALIYASLALQVAGAQAAEVKRIPLLQNDLSVLDHEVVQLRVDFPPGVIAPRHNHPGEEIVYVIEGVLEYQLEGRPPVALKAGDVLFIPDGTIHAVRNVGSGNAAELGTYFVKKGKPLVVLAE